MGLPMVDQVVPPVRHSVVEDVQRLLPDQARLTPSRCAVAVRFNNALAQVESQTELLGSLLDSPGRASIALKQLLQLVRRQADRAVSNDEVDRRALFHTRASIGVPLGEYLMALESRFAITYSSSAGSQSPVAMTSAVTSTCTRAAVSGSGRPPR